MALTMYLIKAPRYQNILTDEYETIPLDDLVLIDKYFFWSMRRAEGKTDAYTLEKWCGIPESKLPHKYVVNYYREFFVEKRFYKEHIGNVSGFSIFTQAARIVKANQVFNWFIQNVMEGKADRDYHEISKAQLEALFDACGKVKAGCLLQEIDGNGENKYIVDEEIGKQHLPLMEETGYFFGPDKYNSIYAMQVINMHVVVKQILDTTDFTKEIVYVNAIWQKADNSQRPLTV